MIAYKIVHLTSAHPRYDTRIFIKECLSLTKAGYQVSLIVADGFGDEVKNNVCIYDVGTSFGRLKRMFVTTGRVFTKAKNLNADIYHLHDPELIPIGLKLKKLGKKVIFDAHEDVPKQLLGKPYLNMFSKKILSLMFSLFERWACKSFDSIITATPFIRDKFLLINSNTVDVNNFPVLGELENIEGIWSDKINQVCYIGGVSTIRGIKEIVAAMALVSHQTRLQLGGTFSEKNLAEEVKQYKGWLQVDELGFVDREGVRKILTESVVGLVTLYPVINYIDALPVKMFEYMSAGIPVIASDFPLWRKIIDESGCGICVNPLEPREIAKAIDYLVENPDIAKEMGENGKKAIYDQYNWTIEAKKLLNVYLSIV